MQKNTTQVWDLLWSKCSSAKRDIFVLLTEENGIRWKRIEKIILSEFGKFQGLGIIEIGAGQGTNAALMAKRGATVTVLDYSEQAIKRAKEFFSANGLSANFLKLDALSLPPNLLGKFDISMSFGLAEHFKGFDRIRINRAHFDLLRKGGIAFISVPNRNNLPYRISKFIEESTGKWPFGEEIPYSRGELRSVCHQLGITRYMFFGDSFLKSFKRISYPSRVMGRVFGRNPPTKMHIIKEEIPSFLDAYLSYALVLCAKK